MIYKQAYSQVIPSIPAHVVTQSVAEEMVLLDVSTERYYGLNASATLVWKLFLDGFPTGSVIAALEAEFGLSHQEAEQDLKLFQQQLAAAGLIETPE